MYSNGKNSLIQKMKNRSTIFLQGVLVLIGIVTIVILIRLPLTEGRAEKLDLFSIYADSFILYGYAASIPFFIALFNAFKLLGYIGQNNAFSQISVKTISNIKYCAFTLSILIVMAGLYIKIFHNKEDDPAGFLALCFIITFASLVVAIAVDVFEKILINGIDLKSENEQLVKGLKKII
jgi:hypothetical protein